jgi:autotransporter-associated beta strand protein
MLNNKNYGMEKKYAVSKKLSWIFLILVFCSGTESWGQPWTYDFGTSTGNYTSSSASETFLPNPSSGTDRVRVGTNPGSIILANPGISLGSGSELQITSNTGSSSTTKFSVYNYTASKFGYVKFKIAFSGGTNGVYNFTIGDGSTFSDNNAMSTSQIFSGLRWSLLTTNAVTFEVLNNTTWGSTGISNSTTLFSQSSSNEYLIEIYYNNTTGTLDYSRTGTTYSITNAKWDIWVDGTLIGNDLAKGGIASDVNIDSWAFNHQSSATTPGTIYIDDIEYSNALPSPIPTIDLSSPTIPTSAINNNTNNNIVGAVQLAVTTADATLNSITFTTAGTYAASDIATNGFKFWLSNSATDISGATQLGTAQAAAGTGSNISVSGLSSIISSGTTRFIVLTADIASSPTSGATIGITSTSHNNITFASGNKTGTDPVAAGTTRSISVATPNISFSSPIASTTNLTQGLTNQEIYRFDLAVTTAAATLNGVTINTAGTYSATDITNIKCWYSADNTFSSVSDELLSTKTTSLGTGTHVFPTFTSKTISSGSTGYIFITVDLPFTATENNTISINAITISDISFLSGNKTGTANASGTKTIIACTPTNVTGLSATAGNGTLIVNWTNPSCVDEIIIVAKPTSSITATPVGDGSSYASNLSFGNGGASAFDGTGFVVYKGTSSPQTITGLTNGTNYFIEVFTRKGTTWSSGSEVNATPNLVNATAILWSNSGGSAWLTGSNWTGSATPTIAQTAQFGANPTGTSVGINMGGSTNNGTSNQITGSIEVTNVRAAALNIGNSSGSTTGTLTISGVVVNNTDNVIIRNNSNQLLTIQANQSSAMTLTLGNVTDNLILINGTGGVTITSNILGASRNLTKRGIGTGILSLEGANTYSGTTTVTEGTLRLNRTGGTTLPTNNDVTINGGIFRVSTNQTLNNLTFTGGELIVDAGATLTINGTLSYTAGTFTLNGNIAYGASSTILFENPSALNLPSVIFTNNPFNVTLNGAGDITLGGNTTITGTLTLATSRLTVGSNTLTLNGNIIRTSGNIDASNAAATVVFSGSSSQSIPDGTFTGNINNLTVNNSNGLTNNQSVIIAGTLTLTTGVFDANNITTLNNSASLIHIGGSIVNYILPSSLNNLTLPIGTSSLVSNLTLTGNLNLGSSIIDIGSSTLTVNGDISRTTGTIKTNGGTLILGGTNSTTLHFDQTTDGTTNKLKDLTINRSGAVVTLGNKLQVAHNGTVIITSGNLATNENLILTSNLSGTARIAELTSGATVTGNVEVQRYMVGGTSSQRGWRYMSSPVANATYAQLIDDIFITGPGGLSNGFDITGGNSSVMTYEESNNRGWKSISSPSNTWATGKGAIVFFRGDRTQTTSLTNTTVAPNSFPVDFVGNINSGNITVNLDYNNTVGIADNQGWNLIGNPYPSQIDWDLVTKTAGVNSHYYLINPNSKNYLSANTGVIAIGQGFFVQVNNSGQSVTFNESNKTGTNGAAYFKTSTNPLTIKMNLDSIQNDVAKIFFVNGANKNYLFTEDAIKLSNTVYNLSIVTPNNFEVQNSYIPHLGNTGTDTFEIKVTSTTNNTYYLSLENFSQISSSKAILLVDKFNNSITNLRITTNYSFYINNSQSSSYGKRFLLIITDQHNPLPIKLTQFSGVNKGLENELNWVTSSEKNILGFEIQKSEDGIDFEAIGFVKANNQNSITHYKFADNQLKKEKNYYRLKINERNNPSFSHLVVLVTKNQPHSLNYITVYPNPAQNILNLNLLNEDNIGEILIYDLFGKLLLENTGTSKIDISKLSSGSYIIQVEINGFKGRTKFTKQ